MVVSWPGDGSDEVPGEMPGKVPGEVPGEMPAEADRCQVRC